MKTITSLIALLLISISNSPAQKEANNWYFGEYAGITFNTPDGSPVALTDGEIDTYEGCSVISDSEGNLSFYTDGVTVWNRNHIPMPNGFDLYGHSSSSQSALIVPKPRDNNIFYIFTVDAVRSDRGFRYSVVDLSLENGLGDVTNEKNVLLLDSATEKLTAARYCDWVIVHKLGSDAFYAYLVTESGVNTNPVISNVGIVHLTGADGYSQGCMKLSPDFTRLTIAVLASSTFEVFDFDNSTGIISNPITLQSSDFMGAYGVEFSPDGKILYGSTTNVDQCRVFQFDLEAGSASDIVNSAVILARRTRNQSCSALQLGPDDKIYLSGFMGYLGVINNPDKLGTACYYVDRGLYLGGRMARHGLPGFVHYYLYDMIKTEKILCEGDTLFLNALTTAGATYEWKGPNGFSSNEQNPVIYDVTTDMTGEYFLIVTVSGCERTSKVEVIIYEFPEVEIIGPNVICEGESVILTAKPSGKGYKYHWSTGSTNSQITINEAGTYTVVAGITERCTDSVSKTITTNPSPEVGIIPNGPTKFCEGDSVILTVFPYVADYSYYWSTGDTIPEITVKESGTYTVIGENSYGCKNEASIYVHVIKNPDVEIEIDGPTTFCEGGSVKLTASPYGAEYDYTWSNGMKGPFLTVTESGTYTVVVKVIEGCKDSASIVVYVIPAPDVEITPDPAPFLCEGDSVVLSTKDEYVSYVWSTGDTTSSIVVKQAGYFSVSVTDSNGCTGESDEIIIKTSPNPHPEISGPNSVCGDTEAQYSIESLPNTTIDWNVSGGNITAGDGTETITVKWNSAGTGLVEVIQTYTSSGCSGSDTLEILIADSLKPDVSLSNPVLCEGGSVTLSAPEGYASYEWNSGETTREITVTEAGIYYVKVTDAEGCSGTSAPVEIIEVQNPEPQITGNRRFCEGDSLNLDLLDYDDYNDILWSTDEKTNRIIVTQPGEYWVEVTDANGCTGTVSVNIEQIVIELSGLEDVSFGSVLILNEAQSSLTISNAGEDAVKIESVGIKGMEGVVFTLETTPGVPVTLEQGESLTITVKFKPDAARVFLDSLIIEISEPCVETRSIACTGSGYELDIESTVRLPELTGTIGDPDFHIPLYAKLDSDTILTNLSYTAEISFDAELFLPEGVSKGNISGSSIAGGERTLVINGFEESLDAEEKILTEIYGLILLGDKDETPLKFNDFSFSNDMPVNKIDGRLRVKGVCIQSLSAIRVFTPTNMAITPNPAGEEVEVKVQTEEKGKFIINIYTIQGIKTETKEWVKTSGGKEEFIIKLRIGDYPNGLYQAVLKTPTHVISSQIAIVK